MQTLFLVIFQGGRSQRKGYLASGEADSASLTVRNAMLTKGLVRQTGHTVVRS